MTNLFVVLNRTEAKFIRRSDGNGPLEVIKNMKNPLGRERNRSMKNSRPGVDRYNAGRAIVSHSMTRERNPHEEAAVQFAREVAEELRKEFVGASENKFTLIADPHMSGILEKQMDSATRAHEAKVIRRNLGKMTEHQLFEYLERRDPL